MNAKTHIASSLCLCAALGCGVAPADGLGDPRVDGRADPFEHLEQPDAQCGGAVERHLANLAGAAAEELGRWEIGRDFMVSAADGGRLALSAEGQSRCADGCPIVIAILDLQDPRAAAPDHDPAALAEAFVSGFERQVAADASLSLDAHALTRIGSEPGSCGELFWFEAVKDGCTGACAFVDPARLSSKLLFAGYPDNRYLAFQIGHDLAGTPASLVAIDPTYTLNEAGTACAATCRAACTIVSSKRLPSSGCGSCCSCNGRTGRWERSVWNAQTYLCRT